MDIGYFSDLLSFFLCFLSILELLFFTSVLIHLFTLISFSSVATGKRWHLPFLKKNSSCRCFPIDFSLLYPVFTSALFHVLLLSLLQPVSFLSVETLHHEATTWLLVRLRVTHFRSHWASLFRRTHKQPFLTQN